MSKLHFLLIIFLFILVININPVDSCSLAHSYIAIETEGQRLHTLAGVYERNELNISKENEFFSSMGYSEQDINIISTLYSELRSYDSSYGHITKQTNTQYNEFKNKVNKVKEDICDCEKLTIVNRISDWTAYDSSFKKKSCSFSTACYQPPFLSLKSPFICWESATMGAFYFKFLFLPIIGIIILVSLVRRFIKKRRES